MTPLAKEEFPRRDSNPGLPRDPTPAARVGFFNLGAGRSCAPVAGRGAECEGVSKSQAQAEANGGGKGSWLMQGKEGTQSQVNMCTDDIPLGMMFI